MADHQSMIITKTVVPLPYVIVVVGCAISATAGVLGGVYHMVNQINQLEAKIVGRVTERFLRVDMTEWCDSAELSNKGWHCPSPYSLPRFRELMGNTQASRSKTALN